MTRVRFPSPAPAIARTRHLFGAGFVFCRLRGFLMNGGAAFVSCFAFGAVRKVEGRPVRVGAERVAGTLRFSALTVRQPG